MYLGHLAAWCVGGLLALRFSHPTYLWLALTVWVIGLAGWCFAKGWWWQRRTQVTGPLNAVSCRVAKWDLPRRYIAYLLLALTAFLLSSMQLSRVQAQQIKQLKLRTMSGCIVSLVEVQDNITRFEFEPLDQPIWHIKTRYRVSWFNAEHQPAPGSCWQLTLRLRAPHGTLNHIGFDYERWLFARRITALGSVKAGRSNRVLDQQHVSQPLLAARLGIYQRIQDSTAHYNSGPLLGALAVGMRHELTVPDWDVLKRSGLAHLMAISGLHIGLAASLGYGVMRWLPPGYWLWSMALRLVGKKNLNFSSTRCSPHQRGLLGALVVASVYAALAGFAVATVRALLMLLLWTLWRWHRRHVDVFFIALLTIALLIVVAPHTLVGISFWLSCGAVLMLGWVAKTLRPGRSWRVRLHHAIRLQWGVLILMLPLTSVVSGGFSLLALPLNLVLIPLFGVLVVPLVLLCLGSMSVGAPWTDNVLQALAWGLDQLWHLLTIVTEHELAFVTFSTWSLWLFLPALLAGAYSMQPMGWPARRWVLVAALPLMLTSASCSTVCLQQGEFSLDVLDTGQALSVVIATRHHIVVYDTGDKWPGGDSAQRALVPWLAHQRNERLTHLVVSHADSDHAGGVGTLLQHYQPEYIWVGERVNGLPNARACREGVAWQSDGVRFSFSYPDSAVTARGNRQSCVLRIDGAGSSVLLTGDLDDFGERALVTGLRAAPVNLVIGAHHGSATSSDSTFIDAAAAQWVVFSNGADNQWGMPRPQVRARWARYNTQVLTTAESGQISFLSRRAKPLLITRTARSSRPGVWRQTLRP